MKTRLPFAPESPAVRPRRAFTLIELLVVLTIIAILVGLLVPAVMTAYGRAQSFAIEQEMNQMEAAIDQFKTKYGFYPPDCSRFTSALDIVPFLNRIAPNHSETAANIGAWWNQVGQYLKPDSSYVFWLSALAKNKQYPLTGGTGTPLAAYTVGTVEREVFFEFKTDRLYNPATKVLIGTSGGMYATYSQATGSCQPYAYFELKSWIPSMGIVSALIPMTSGNVTVYPYSDGTTYYNRDSIQILAPGLDGLYSFTSTTTSNIANINNRERDNLTNFTKGRLEKLVLQ